MTATALPSRPDGLSWWCYPLYRSTAAPNGQLSILLVELWDEKTDQTHYITEKYSGPIALTHQTVFDVAKGFHPQPDIMVVQAELFTGLTSELMAVFDSGDWANIRAFLASESGREWIHSNFVSGEHWDDDTNEFVLESW